MIDINWNSPLHPGQQEIWNALFEMTDGKHRYKKVVVNTGRQVGKTTLAKRWAVNRLLSCPGCEIGWMAPENKHFVKVFNWFTNNLAGEIKKQDQQKNIIWFDNGSVLYFHSVDNYDAIRGQTFDFRIMDEFSFGRFSQDEAIKAYSPTMVAKGKQELILSTPKGKNQHYQAYTAAQADPNQFAYAMRTQDNPSVDRDFLRAEKTRLPRAIYQQEYEGKFLDSGGEVFNGLDLVCTLKAYAKQQANKRYYAGIDWGAKNDKSVLTIIDDDGVVAEIKHSYLDDYPSIIAEFVSILDNYNLVGGLAETNGVGQASFDYLRRSVPVIEPFVMSNKSKIDLVQLTRSKIEHKLVQLPSRELEPGLFNEMSDYSVTVSDNGLYKYSHPKGGHDDFVDSLMFAIKAAHQPYSPQFNATPRTTHRRMKMI